MSDSLTIRVDRAVMLDTRDLCRRTGEVLRLLLNQDESFAPELQITPLKKDVAESITVIAPGADLYGFYEQAYLGRGVSFFYDTDPYWDLYSERPIFQFVITDIKRNYGDMNLMFCIAIAIAVAELFGVFEVIDMHGVWMVGVDEISTDKLLQLAVDKHLPLADAIKEFYEKIPVKC